MNTAENLARVTGSTAATVTHERRLPSGELVVESVETYDRTMCEHETQPVHDFDGSGWISFECKERATHVVTFTDLAFVGTPFERCDFNACEGHATEAFVELDTDDAFADVKRDAL